MNKTSISDNSEYRQICLLAANNEQDFNIFKQNPSYIEILEHCSYEQGLVYKEYIDQNLSDINSFLEKFKQNDTLGSPTKYQYENIGLISASTLRYIKVLTDLKKLFDSLDNFSIVEIGVGYGGQCKIISDYYNLSNYSLIDLDEPLALTNKYLSLLNVKNFNIVNFDKIDNSQIYDLVISNYAFTEISREIQLQYIQNVIYKSKHGYITCNFISQHFNIDSLSLEELIEILSVKFNVQKMQEYPLTFENNVILYW